MVMAFTSRNDCDKTKEEDAKYQPALLINVSWFACVMLLEINKYLRFMVFLQLNSSPLLSGRTDVPNILSIKEFFCV